MSWGKNLYELARIPVKRVCNGYYVRWYYNGWHYWFFYPGQYSMTTEGEKYRTIGTRKIRISSGQVNRNQAMTIRTILNTREVSLLTIAGWMNIRVEPTTVEVYDFSVAGSELEFDLLVGSKEITYTTGYSPVIDVPVVPPAVAYCEVVIGNQIWMCKNFDSNYPGSKVYNNDEANRSLYGGLYTYTQIMSPGFVPEGWHVPTLAEWNDLFTFIGGLATAGGILKSLGFTYWDAPNTGAVDTYGFDARGAGAAYIDTFTGATVFTLLNRFTYFWTADSVDDFSAVAFTLRHNTADALQLSLAKSIIFNSLRLIKNTSFVSCAMDIDGNNYSCVIIGSQVWMVENLRTTKYADGTPIPNLILNADWIAEDGTPGHDGAYCWYDNDIANKADYGALYNNYAVNNAHGLAPAGWRVPDSSDFTTLVNFLGGYPVAGGKLKEIGLIHWDAPNAGATDEFGFRGFGSGLRNYFDGSFSLINKDLALQCTDDVELGLLLWHYDVSAGDTTSIDAASSGWSVRCMRDL